MTENLDNEKFTETHKKIVQLHEEVFKEIAKQDKETTKDVESPLPVSPDVPNKVKRERTELEKQIDEEMHNMSPEELMKQFDETRAIIIPGKKDKKLKPRSYYCSTCREWFLEDKSDKRPMGFDRNEDGSMTMKSTRFSVFCPSCSKFISIIDPETDAKIKDAIDKVGNK